MSSLKRLLERSLFLLSSSSLRYYKGFIKKKLLKEKDTMRILDYIKNTKSDIELAKMLSFKVAQEINGKLNDQKKSSEAFYETKEKFYKTFLEWFKEEKN